MGDEITVVGVKAVRKHAVGQTWQAGEVGFHKLRNGET